MINCFSDLTGPPNSLPGNGGYWLAHWRSHRMLSGACIGKVRSLRMAMWSQVGLKGLSSQTPTEQPASPEQKAG